jgi:hypothetical protein
MTRKSVASGSAIAGPALGIEEYDDRVTISVNIADGGNKPVRLPRRVLRLIIIETSGSALSGIEACLNRGLVARFDGVRRMCQTHLIGARNNRPTEIANTWKVDRLLNIVLLLSLSCPPGNQ